MSWNLLVLQDVQTASTAARCRVSRRSVSSVRKLSSLRSWGKSITSPRTRSLNTVQKMLAFAALNFIDAQMFRAVLAPG